MTIRGPRRGACAVARHVLRARDRADTPDEIPEPGTARAVHRGERETRQTRNEHLILQGAGVIAWGSRFYTLHPGDVLLTGTPQGPSWAVRPGDVMLASIERLGSMRVDHMNKILPTTWWGAIPSPAG